MGYGCYELPDGRQAGYAVLDTCNFPECEEEIDRGMDYLCGEFPLGNTPKYIKEDLYGCGNYFCADHQECRHHNCSTPICGVYSLDSPAYCFSVKGHEHSHYDYSLDYYFTEVEPEFLEF